MIKETFDAKPLETLAEKITQYANEADERTIKAVMLIREARKRVEAGEAGETTWYAWAPENIELSKSRLRELQRIADADDPRKELERLRKQNANRQARHREKAKTAPLRNGGAPVKRNADLEEDREALIAWARSAPLKHVKETLSFARSLNSRTTASDADMPAQHYVNSLAAVA